MHTHTFCLSHAPHCANVGPGLLSQFLLCMNGTVGSLEAKKQTLAQGEGAGLFQVLYVNLKGLLQTPKVGVTRDMTSLGLSR